MRFRDKAPRQKLIGENIDCDKSVSELIQQNKDVYFIFQNQVGAVLHGKWKDANHFVVAENPSAGPINVQQWQKLGGGKFHYVLIPEGVKPNPPY